MNIVILLVDIRDQHIVFVIAYVVSHEIPFVFHNGSNYDFQLVIKHLANILVQVIMNFIGANTEKYNSVSITWDKKNCK